MDTQSKIKLLLQNPARFLLLARNVLSAKFSNTLSTPEGNRFSTDLEVATLKKYASGAKLGIVEIGVLDGKTTKEMAQGASVPIYGIDPIIPDSMNKRLVGHEQLIAQNMAFYKQFTFIKDFSYNAVRGWQKPFDFIFIDGDHRYEAVKKDYEDWLPHLATGGYMGFHDSAAVTSIPGAFSGWEGPIQLIAELKKDSRVEFIETQDSLTIVRKK